MGWYKYTAYNSETLYGWTDDENVAETALDYLNRNRNFNFYCIEHIEESEVPSGHKDNPWFGEDAVPEDWDLFAVEQKSDSGWIGETVWGTQYNIDDAEESVTMLRREYPDGEYRVINLRTGKPNR